MQAWALLNSFGAVWFGQIWVGDGAGHFDGKGSIGALAVVNCQRWQLHTCLWRDGVDEKENGHSTGSERTGFSGTQRATVRISITKLFIYSMANGHLLFK